MLKIGIEDTDGDLLKGGGGIGKGKGSAISVPVPTKASNGLVYQSNGKHTPGQLGELRNRAAEAMAYRASGLNLVVNAIVLWNTVYLSRVVDYVRSQGIIIPEDLLSSVAPLPWGHISLTGDYLWNEIDRPLERYRPVRTKRFNPKNFTFP